MSDPFQLNWTGVRRATKKGRMCVSHIVAMLLYSELTDQDVRQSIPSELFRSNIDPPTLQRQNTEISKQMFPEKEYRGLSPNFHTHEC
jgi:hypothetical protein